MSLKSLPPVKRRSVDVIRVFRSPGSGRRGRIRGGGLDLPCALGRSGIGHRKREGDGGTPAGRARVIALYYRADRLRYPGTLIVVQRLRRNSGWCDDPASRLYNRPVQLPHSGSHELMWRDDALYDVVLDLAFNRRPVVRGRGSAIFLHVAGPGLAPTEGCVAVERRRIARLVSIIGRRTIIEIVGGSWPGRRPPLTTSRDGS